METILTYLLLNPVSLVFVVIIAVAVVLVRYYKEIKSGGSWLFKLLQHSGKNNQPARVLLSEIDSLKKTIQAQKNRLDEIEAYLNANRVLFDVVYGIKNHPCKIYTESFGIVLRLTDTLRIQQTENMKEYLLMMETLVRQLPFADRRLSLDLSDCRYLNATAMHAISDLFIRISIENGIRLKVILPAGNALAKFFKNLKALEESGPTNSAIVVLANHDGGHI